jgi:phosphoglycolate phosphatase
MTRDFELIIFDLDGTLIDSSALIEDAVQETLKKHGLPKLLEGYVASRIGKPPGEFFEIIAPKESIEILVQDFRLLMGSQAYLHPKVYPGVPQVLSELRNKNTLMAIATTKPTGLAEKVLESTGLLQYFSHVQGSESFKAKPDPSTLLACMGVLKTDKALMVGDTEDDIMAANNAGIKCVAVDHGSRPTKTLLDAQPWLVINHISQLVQAVESLSL